MLVKALEECGDSDGKLKIRSFARDAKSIFLLEQMLEMGMAHTSDKLVWVSCSGFSSSSAYSWIFFLMKVMGVFVTKWSLGSPADRYCLSALKWIVQVNGKPTSDLDAFANVVKELGPDECVRVKTVDLDGKPQVQTLKQDFALLAYVGVEI
ncbi:hypothetical protein NC651_012040 [Populus alba x Populus x berolinensis]|nr:hypothetical protein NC651_012040 [Populus alba x Populus x berolinensis]